MSQPEDKLYIPPYSGVRLIECRDHFQLVPVPDVRVVYGYGKIKASDAKMDPDDPESTPIWDHLAANEEIWIVMQWFQYVDGKLIPGDCCYLKPECTEEQVQKRMREMEEFSNL
ncbi:MAG TPA: hypothetical protein VNZ25_10305, partial [Candidatus Angelobacter sp.]|nr:hypothetical protein [Candidatus Angelobacter sp.]